MLYLVLGVIVLLATRYPSEFATMAEFLWFAVTALAKTVISVIEYVILFVYHYRYHIIFIAVILGYILILWPN